MTNETKTPDWMKPADDLAHIDVTLRRQYTIAGVKTNAIRMREPTVNDQLTASEMSGSDAAKEVRTLANLCDLSPEDIKQLGSPDYQRLQRAYTHFFD